MFCPFYFIYIVWLILVGKLAVWLRVIQFAWMSSRCKWDAWLTQPRPGFDPSAPSGTLTVLRLASPCQCYFIRYFGCVLTGESDGRCVRVSEPGSKGHSISFLLLNPPSSIVSWCMFVIFCGRKCSPFLSTSCATPRPDVLGCTHFAYFYYLHRVSWRRRYIGWGG